MLDYKGVILITACQAQNETGRKTRRVEWEFR